MILIQLFSLQIVGLGGITVVYLYLTDRDIDFLRIKTPSIMDSLTILVGPIALVMLSGLLVSISVFLGESPSPHGFVGILQENPKIALYLIPISILVIGPFEELLFRGVIQTELVTDYENTYLGVIAASFIFAIVHLPAYSGGGVDISSILASIGGLFVLSIFLGSLYEWRDNLVVSMGVHGLYNSILFLSIYLSQLYNPEEIERFMQALVF